MIDLDELAKLAEAREIAERYGVSEWREKVLAVCDALESVRAERDAALAAVERVRAAKHEVDSVHQIHGADCLCGYSSARSRSRTEHITEAMLAALDGAPEPVPLP